MRILIAGLGAIGQRHARNLRAISGEGLELLAYRRRRLSHVVTEALQRDDSRDVESELGITAFGDLDEALTARPDAVFVCTPPSQHLDIAQRAADAGCHLFVEKPVSHTLDGVARLRQTVASKGLVALVGCQWRYHPCARWLRDVLEQGLLGTVESAEISYAEYLPDWHPYEDYRTSYAARRELGGGVVLTQIHDYDLAWWLFGAPSSVTASGGRSSTLEIDVEDTVDAYLECRAPVRLRQTFAEGPPRRTIGVRGTAGLVDIDLLGGRIASSPQLIAPDAFAAFRRNDMFVEEVRHFVNCIEGRARPAVPLEDGIAVLRVAVAVKDAIQTGRRVEIV